MKDYIKVFKRVEQKYMLTKSDFEKLMQILEPKMEKNKYFESKILNIYFDTDNFDIATKTIEKTKYKEKLRLRSYSVPKSDDENVFFELKRKCNSVVSKRRITMKLNEFEEYIKYGKLFQTENMQILKEIDYTKNTKKLKPKMMVAYDRFSYYLIGDENTRITFDFDLRYRDEMLNLKMGDAGHKFFKNDIIIMEVKTLGSMPIWFVKLMNELKIYPTSFSKYGEIYKKHILSKKINKKYDELIINKNKIKKQKVNKDKIINKNIKIA